MPFLCVVGGSWSAPWGGLLLWHAYRALLSWLWMMSHGSDSLTTSSSSRQLWQLIGDCWGMDHSRGLLRQLSTAVNATEEELSDLSFPHPIFGAPPVSQAPGSNKDDSTGPSFDLHPFLASLETGDGAAVLLHAAELKTGTARILTNPIFTEAFFSAKDAVNQMNDERSLIWMIYAR